MYERLLLIQAVIEQSDIAKLRLFIKPTRTVLYRPPPFQRFSRVGERVA